MELFLSITKCRNQNIVKKCEEAEKQQTEFDSIKQTISTASVLSNPDFTKSFQLYKHACGQNFRAVLLQGHEDLNKVIAFASKRLSNKKNNIQLTNMNPWLKDWQ